MDGLDFIPSKRSTSALVGKLTRIFNLITAVAVMLLLPANCGPSTVTLGPFKAEATLPPIHHPTAEHTLDDIMLECGLGGTKLVVDAKEPWNIIAGRALLEYDENYGAPDGKFRMALLVLSEGGTKKSDFFEGITCEGGGMVGDGNARLKVPKLTSALCYSGYLPGMEEGVRLFCDEFPELLGRDFELTFKEFSGHVYFLRDVPPGIAFVWFQTDFDGNRVTQFPVAIEIPPEDGAITRMDITVTGYAFHTL